MLSISSTPNCRPAQQQSVQRQQQSDVQIANHKTEHSGEAGRQSIRILTLLKTLASVGRLFNNSGAFMSRKRKIQGGVLGLIGFLLSPLSWWNDAFINLPLAIGFGWLVALVYRPAFEAAAIVGYWLTNVLGFVLMHKGAQKLLRDGEPKPYSMRAFGKDLAVSLLYTVLIVGLLRLKVLQPLTSYFTTK